MVFTHIFTVARDKKGERRGSGQGSPGRAIAGRVYILRGGGGAHGNDLEPTDGSGGAGGPRSPRLPGRDTLSRISRVERWGRGSAATLLAALCHSASAAVRASRLERGQARWQPRSTRKPLAPPQPPIRHCSGVAAGLGKARPHCGGCPPSPLTRDDPNRPSSPPAPRPPGCDALSSPCSVHSRRSLRSRILASLRVGFTGRPTRWPRRPAPPAARPLDPHSAARLGGPGRAGRTDGRGRGARSSGPLERFFALSDQRPLCKTPLPPSRSGDTVPQCSGQPPRQPNPPHV